MNSQAICAFFFFLFGCVRRTGVWGFFYLFLAGGGGFFCVAIRVGKQAITIISKETRNIYIQLKKLA